ncbi:MAG: cytochrome d ubiquinol oxidase subunit II [Dysgonamonadaceae bacterium]|jgi:cytochrome d ubiquinol oxidase subunit II|nr:cytochrome d ubiquinol oxidase subunit II [Dysgonamonadaceae bacterium]
MDYSFYQHYWWFLVSLLGALLVFLLFVQGGQSQIYTLGKEKRELDLLFNSMAKKWELTFTTLVTFGGAFFASFPLFYSTSFGGAYWVWMLILFSFVIQTVGYEFMNKKGNFLGNKTYKLFLFLNGALAPILLGTAVSTLFFGAEFVVQKENLAGGGMPVISSWQNALHGLEAVGNLWNVAFGIAVFFLSRSLGCLYFINNIQDESIRKNSRKHLLYNAVLFLLFFLPYLINLLLKSGLAENAPNGIIAEESYKYFNNLWTNPWILVLLLVGVVLVLYGFIRGAFSEKFIYGIWYAGPGVVLVVLSLLLIAGFGGTAYYPSLVDAQSSLTITNSSSSLFTLKTMSVVSLLIPFVLAYIWYVWRAMDKK